MEAVIDIERLRNDLINYFGTAYTVGFGMAVVDVVKVQRATDEELIDIANECNINLEKYIIKVLKY